MTYKSVRQVIEALESFYKDDTQMILAYWWDMDDVAHHTEDMHLPPDRIKEIWENAAEETHEIEEYGLNSISETLTNCLYSQFTDEEVDHAQCMVVVENGAEVHKPFEELVERE